MTKLILVTTTCPFCSGGVSVSSERSELTNAEVSRSLSGKKVGCQHANCGKTFFVRRADLKIRREEN
jgi:hypothetical protein